MLTVVVTWCSLVGSLVDCSIVTAVFECFYCPFVFCVHYCTTHYSRCRPRRLVRFCPGICFIFNMGDPRSHVTPRNEIDETCAIETYHEFWIPGYKLRDLSEFSVSCCFGSMPLPRSRRNPRRSRDCVSSVTGLTGQTFFAFCQYLRTVQPDYFYGEMVSGLI